MKSIKFYINKYSYIENEKPDVSFIPMLMRRKLNTFGKAALFTLYNAYGGNENTKLVFASEYGDIERVNKLIDQRQSEGEISPAGFSFSVHNASIGLFSLLKKLNSSYTSVSAGEKTLAAGILETVLQIEGNNPVLLCFTENKNQLQSVSLLCSKNNSSGIEVTAELIQTTETGKDNFNSFIRFLNGEVKIFNSGLYVLKRD